MLTNANIQNLTKPDIQNYISELQKDIQELHKATLINRVSLLYKKEKLVKT